MESHATTIGDADMQRVWTTLDNEREPSTNNHSALAKEEIEKLAAFRYALRQFTRKTEIEARRVGLTPQQYLLLLAIKGFPGRETATITELAERLQIRHNAVIGLVNRAEERKLVGREAHTPGEDRRIVRVRLLAKGDEALVRLASALRDERQRIAMTAAAWAEAGE